MSKTMKNSTLRWIYGVIGKKKRYIAVLLIVQIWISVSGVVYAMFLRNVIDGAAARDGNGFVNALFWLVGLVLLLIASQAAARYVEEAARSDYENRFKLRLFESLLYRDYSKVTATHSGEWMNRLTSDTVVVSDGLTAILPGVFGMIAKMAGALVMILFLEKKFALVLIPGGVLLLAISYFFRKIMKKLHKKMQEADGRVRMFLQENLGSLMVVKSFACERDTLDGAADKMATHRKERMKKNHFSNFCNVGFGGAMNGIYLLGVAYCGYGILKGTISYGTLMAILQLIGQIQTPFANITSYLPKYYAMMASAERLMEAEEYTMDSPVDDTVAAKDYRAIGMRGAAFSYEGQQTPVFENWNIEIAKGEYVAFAGPSGCGKSTVMKIFLSLYSLDEGDCYVKFAKETEPLTSAVRTLFAYVPQGNHLMSGTIREIVAFAGKEAMMDDKRLWRAMKISCADEFVKELPDGIDTLLGERGLGLSEGQMQRIAIARAIFADNPILMLDEATSALDEKTEEMLLKNLKAMTDKTVLIVTHRPAALEICDRVIRYEEGD